MVDLNNCNRADAAAVKRTLGAVAMARMAEEFADRIDKSVSCRCDNCVVVAVVYRAFAAAATAGARAFCGDPDGLVELDRFLNGFVAKIAEKPTN